MDIPNSSCCPIKQGSRGNTAYYVVPWQFFFSHHAKGKETSCIVIILNVHWSWFTNAQFILYSTESLRKGERELTELPRIFNGFLMFNKVKCSFHYLLYSGFSSFDWKGFLDGIVISNNLLTIALLLVLKRTNSNDTCFFSLMLWVILSLLYPDSFVCGFTNPPGLKSPAQQRCLTLFPVVKSSLLVLSYVLNMIIFILEYQQQYREKKQGCIQLWWKQTQLTGQHGAWAWSEGHSRTTAVNKEFMRREGENNCRGWRNLVEKAYETERGGRKEKRKMYFSVERACRQESDKMARREKQSEEEDDVQSRAGIFQA